MVEPASGRPKSGCWFTEVISTSVYYEVLHIIHKILQIHCAVSYFGDSGVCGGGVVVVVGNVVRVRGLFFIQSSPLNPLSAAQRGDVDDHL